MSYQLVKDTISGSDRTDVILWVDDDGISHYIPNNSANIDWANYQNWLALGNTPQASS